MNAKTHADLQVHASQGSVSETVARLRTELERRAVRVFAHIDHAEAAREVGLDLRETQVVLFGNPVVGTILMQMNDTVALSLPLKVVVYASDAGTQIAYLPLIAQAETFGLDPGAEIVGKLDRFMASLAAVVGGGEASAA